MGKDSDVAPWARNAGVADLDRASAKPVGGRSSGTVRHVSVGSDRKPYRGPLLQSVRPMWLPNSELVRTTSRQVAQAWRDELSHVLRRGVLIAE